MRTTVRMDDDLMTAVKERARSEGLSITRMLNRVVRTGLEALRQAPAERKAYREKTFRMGRPQLAMDKALALAAALEDEEVIRKMTLRK